MTAMIKSQIEAARALVTSRRFRSGFPWMPGMRAINSTGTTYRVVLAGDAYEDADGTAEWINVGDGREYYPDLTDPATLGCLLALAREAFGDGGLHVTLRSVSPPWRCMTGAGKPVGTWRDTEGEALAAAILAAPVKP